MQLHPCAGCRRHVRDATCPFCGAAQPTLMTKLVHASGRLSRAAVFAGAAACYTNANTPRQQQQLPPPPPPDGEQFAQPPPDDHQQHVTDETVPDKAVPATGSIEGQILESGRPVVGVMVQLQSRDGGQAQARTDGQGRYVFTHLRPGSYLLTNMATHNPRMAPEERPVEVRADAVVRADFEVQPYVPDRGPCCKPYGAPPARRRVV